METRKTVIIVNQDYFAAKEIGEGDVQKRKLYTLTKNFLSFNLFEYFPVDSS